MKTITGYLAPVGYGHELFNELKNLTEIIETHDRLILAKGKPVQAHWAQNIWLNPREIEVKSIQHASQELKKIQRNWSLYSFQLHRRAQLIADQLPKINLKPAAFPLLLPKLPMGAWTLLDSHRILASSECSSLFPNGEIHFQENKTIPPSRAYLKLWEALSLCNEKPQPGQKCLDMGSSPGGWTWVLQGLGMNVLSVDKAPLTPLIAQLPGVNSLKQDAFTLDPEVIGQVDWFFSDVICYPEKLLQLVQRWMKSGKCNKFICTIKFQGSDLSSSDQKALEGFSAIAGSKIIHLFHNKHELTWMKL